MQKAGVPPQCPVHSGPLAQAIRAARPDVIHVHYLVMAERFAGEFPPGIPVTVRGHSFDWDPAVALRVAELPSITKVFLFPAFARQVPHPKIVPLPVAYSTARYAAATTKDRRLVLRLGAQLPTKGFADIFSVARLLPDHRFVLGVARAGGAAGFEEKLGSMNSDGRVDLRLDLSWEEAAALTAEAGIYLYTADPTLNPFGMPISIAESLSTGSLVLVRQAPAAAEMLGGAGRLYDSSGDAAAIIRDSQGWSDAAWDLVSKTAVLRAQAFADTEVLPKLLDEWRLATGKA